MTNFCIDCRYCVITETRNEYAKCARYAEPSPVDGSPVMRYCTTERQRLGNCTSDAIGYAAKHAEEERGAYDDEARQDAYWRQEFERRERATNGKA